MPDTQDEDVVLEPEDDGIEEKADAKLKKLRAELMEAKNEAAEYLAGWQRSKADYINLSRRMREEGIANAQNGVFKMAKSVISVFDSLEAAEKNADEAGDAVLGGIRQVIKQLEGALGEHGITRFTPLPGGAFDPERHEVVRTVATSEEKEDNTVSETLQSGYELGGAVIRPARVAVKHYQHNS